MPTEDNSTEAKPDVDWKQYWTVEFAAARQALEGWHSQGERIESIMRDERVSANQGETRWNLFPANIETKQAMLYGRPPQVSVDRRHADQADDVARVAGEMLQRLLNTDIERKSDGYCSALKYALNDRLLPGWGLARARYVEEREEVPGTPAVMDEQTGEELAPEVPPTERIVRQDVETDYVHYKDQIWKPSRIFHEMGWWAQRIQMSDDQGRARFKDAWNGVPMNGKNLVEIETGQKTHHPWGRADVWEIWSKDHLKVFWFVEGHGVLDMQDDPYGLEGFYPFPQPMAANLTNSKLVPRPDYVIAQDLYSEINTVSTRINRLVQAAKVRGIYNKASPEVARLLDEEDDAKLIPCDNWNAFAEGGGLKGIIDWMPLETIVAAVMQLRDYRRELQDALYQITGMSDILRGQATQAGASAHEQVIKARFGSVRIQHLQDEFARFASELQDIRAQLIAKFFEPQTILERCNCKFTPDAANQQLIMAAVDLIKSKVSQYRIEVKSENVSLTDFAALKQERLEVLQAFSMFITSITPFVQAVGPAAMPFSLQMLQATMVGLRGSSAFEPILDQAIQQAQQAAQQAAQNPQPQQPDPKVIAAQMKMQGDMMKIDAETKARLTEIQAEVQADAQREANQMRFNVQEAAQKQLISNALKPPEPPKPNGGWKP